MIVDVGIDMGHVWGWGYGGEGQLGLGSRMRIVSSPQHIPCFNLSENGTASSGAPIPGKYIKAIACGGRHSAVVTGTDAYKQERCMFFLSLLFNQRCEKLVSFSLFGEMIGWVDQDRSITHLCS